MTGKPLQAIIWAAIIMALGAVTCAADQTSESAAIEAARGWLAIVDRGAYRDSWQQASQYFKQAVKPANWQKQLAAVRDPLGAVLQREVKGATYTTSVPGAPDGEYVVVQFQTTFEKKRSAVETVTPMKEKDGSWRVSGYFIR